jgi:carboxylesterase type B
MVWVHGGAFRNKAGGSDTYDATKFVQRSIEIGRPVVVVNVTHRLNVFGFFSSSEIQKEVQDDGEKVFGSWGIDDIAIGVQWVKCNAEPSFCALLCPMLIHPHILLDKATYKRFWR